MEEKLEKESSQSVCLVDPAKDLDKTYKMLKCFKPEGVFLGRGGQVEPHVLQTCLAHGRQYSWSGHGPGLTYISPWLKDPEFSLNCSQIYLFGC
jgi:hypothetical protein